MLVTDITLSGPGSDSDMVALLCTVRGCAQTLERHDRHLVCPQGHSFDIARRGYVNLLQPQDRRARQPGDSADVVAARRRFLDRGHADALAASLRDHLRAMPVSPATLLDVGCGDGYFLQAMTTIGDIDAHGLDISKAAAEAAARRLPTATVVIANADRRLPYASGSFAAVTSITSHLSLAEAHRVVADRGRLLVVVPAEDDLIELREAVQGEGRERPRDVRLQELPSYFVEESATIVRSRIRLQGPDLRDLLQSTYRGARRSQQERVGELDALEVTLSWDVRLLRPRGGAGRPLPRPNPEA